MFCQILKINFPRRKCQPKLSSLSCEGTRHLGAWRTMVECVCRRMSLTAPEKTETVPKLPSGWYEKSEISVPYVQILAILKIKYIKLIHNKDRISVCYPAPPFRSKLVKSLRPQTREFLNGQKSLYEEIHFDNFRRK